ncbi:amidohydrolase [Siculibacillus lacustris]|uniref:Amidohydrolase n=1 Tax=Siculibacillus lacustris TaxID=1549641 RepID=A0A4Q9VQF6_9HYPH|nr:amidohydrolase [Siculibacillus lacustris]TBW38039.1 amidohydrolase [Siculibacillus lacustris]
MTQNSERLWDLIDGRWAAYAELSDRIWDVPELNYTETHAAGLHAAMLEREGFRVTTGIAGLPTAMVGEAGEGGPVIAILGEYDALPGLSQQAGVDTPTPVEAGGHGHGCGHNMLGAASLLAAAAIKDWLAETGRPGRVRYYGCPAEEGGSAKTFMARDGVFSDVDVAICWHPAAFTGVNAPVSLACSEMDFHFTGRASHAAASPELGRSALDAVELMNVGVNYMREHMPSSARVHYAIVDGGGIAANVVQAKATVRYLIRARELADMHTLVARVRKIAEGATLMTETSVKVTVLSGDANLIGNGPLEQAMHQAIVRLGPVPFDAADQAFAARFRATLSAEEISAAYKRAGLPVTQPNPLSETIIPPDAWSADFVGSTDVGSVSWVVPTVQARVACYAVGTPGHSWQLVAQGKAPAAHKGMTHAAKIMATTAGDLFADEVTIARARREFEAWRAGTPFLSPLPADAVPPLDMAKASKAR